MTIKILDALAGAGKTTAIIKAAIDMARRDKRPVNISLPTQAVIDEKMADALVMASGDVPILRVDGSTADPMNMTVSEQLTQTLAGLGSRKGAVLFTTHKTFNDCTNWIGRKDWKFYIDEVFDPVSCVVLKVPRSYHLITDLLELETPDEDYSVVRLRAGKSHSVAMMRDGTDDGERAFAEIASYIGRPTRWSVHVRTANYRRVTSGIGRSQIAGERQMASDLTFWVLAKPWFETEGLDVTIASACLKDRLLYKLWQMQGVDFAPDEDLIGNLRCTHHDGAGLRLICMNIGHWSSHAKNSGALEGDSKGAAQLAFEALITAEFGDEPFIYNANTTWTDEHLFPSGVRLPLVMHGKNEFATYRNVAFMPSTLPVPDKWRLLSSLGLSADDIRDEYYHSHAYQTVFRSAARLDQREGVITALLPGRVACDYIQRRAPGAEIVVRDVLAERRGAGRPKKFSDAADRKRSEACRQWLRRNPGKTAQDYAQRQTRNAIRQAA